MKTILIQGAIESEIQYYVQQEYFQNAVVTVRNGFPFCISDAGADGKTRIIVGLTKMGMTNAALATMTAIYEFHPDLILNQGTAGAQVKELTTGDVVIGREAVNVHSLEMPKRDFGEGMDPQAWKGMQTEALSADEKLISLFEDGFAGAAEDGKAIVGTLGSGDLFSKEKDRIGWLNQTFHHVSEDMESFAVYEACRDCQVPCLSIRVISNNELLDEAYQPETAFGLQKKIWNILMEKIAG